VNKLIITTCGTSILTNLNRGESVLYANSNVKEINEITNQEDREKIQTIFNASKDKLNNADIEEAKSSSAELNGLFTYFKGLPAAGSLLYLLPTDTLLGKKAAELIGGYLEDKCGIRPIIIEQSDLQTKDFSLFQNALSELSEKLKTIYESYEHNYKIIYNLTGGFKSVNAFLQTLAQFFAHESFYLFESSKELMRIPRLPVQLTIKEELENNLKAIRKMDLGLQITKDEAKAISELLIIEIDGDYALSLWGNSLWDISQKEIYSAQLHDSPSDLVIFSGEFIRSIDDAKLTKGRICEINKKIDDLAKYAHTNGEYNPKSLDCKALAGKKIKESTHECDAWHDQDAKRIYFHKSGNKIILDRLDKALH
jgi:putative CRISPR-associated protein (TIGR02619 family)